MTYQVLARKWRPKKFQDVIGQEAITRSLQNAIKRGRLGHAYLFSGTRGIGKTSVARLFAQAIRCESLAPDGNPCGICAPCLDMQQSNSMNVIEIDGASNNTVDEVRELINNVQYLPTNGNYKVYIIDEVHMLSKSAFNALLKTLEEPPAHVIFLLATTEPHKLLGTVLSRCQRFDFVNASTDDLCKHLLKIAQSEGIEFDSEELVRDVARLGHGSVRDTLSLLDQALSYTSDNHISEEVLAQSLGVVRRKVLDQITLSLINGDSETALKSCRAALAENISLKTLVRAILENFFNLLENLDSDEWLSKRPQIQESISSIAAAELFWVYESMARETTWIFDSLTPEPTFFVLLKKMAMRHQLLGLEATPSEAKKKIEIPREPIKVKTPEPEKIIVKVKELEEFLKLLEAEAPALAASLEHANLSPQEFKNNKILRVKFPVDGQVFYDVINQDNSHDRLQSYLKEFVSSEHQLMVEIAPVENESLRTRAQDRKAKDQVNEEERRQSLMQDPMLKMAQEMFNTKVDKIQLAKKED